MGTHTIFSTLNMAVAAILFAVLLQCPVFFGPSVTQANQFAVDCSFGKPENLASNLTMSATFKGRLAASKYLSHLCVVKTSGQSQEKRFLQVKAKLEDNESTGKRVYLLSSFIFGEFTSF